MTTVSADREELGNFLADMAKEPEAVLAAALLEALPSASDALCERVLAHLKGRQSEGVASAESVEPALDLSCTGFQKVRTDEVLGEVYSWHRPEGVSRRQIGLAVNVLSQELYKKDAIAQDIIDELSCSTEGSETFIIAPSPAASAEKNKEEAVEWARQLGGTMVEEGVLALTAGLFRVDRSGNRNFFDGATIRTFIPGQPDNCSALWSASDDIVRKMINYNTDYSRSHVRTAVQLF